jgi:hypothetical protein
MTVLANAVDRADRDGGDLLRWNQAHLRECSKKKTNTCNFQMEVPEHPIKEQTECDFPTARWQTGMPIETKSNRSETQLAIAPD